MGATVLPPQMPSLDNDQMTALYSQCIQLSTNNKIDVKNAWSLKLIDYIEDVLKQDETPTHETNFQKARLKISDQLSRESE